MEVKPAKKDSPELKLANRHSEIQLTHQKLRQETRLKKRSNLRITRSKNISIEIKSPLKNILILHIL